MILEDLFFELFLFGELPDAFARGVLTPVEGRVSPGGLAAGVFPVSLPFFLSISNWIVVSRYIIIFLPGLNSFYQTLFLLLYSFFA